MEEEKRLAKIEAKGLAHLCLLEALIASHPDPDALQEAWRQRSSHWLATILSAQGEIPGGLQPQDLLQLEALKREMAEADSTLSRLLRRSPPS